MAINRPLQKNASGELEEIIPILISTGAPDASKLVQTNAQGKIDVTLLPTGIGADTVVAEANEALQAGDFVNLYDDGGTFKARLADASDVSTKAWGFVLSAYIATDPATVYMRGENDQLAGLTAGEQQFLSETAGEITTTPPSTDGAYCQQIGIATSANSVDFERVLGVIKRA